MEKISSQKLAKILDYNDNIVSVEIDNVSTDSRKVTPTSVFIALKGERFDGHDFVESVINNGCPLVIVDHRISSLPQEKQIIIDDTLKAYGKIGAYNRSRYKGKIIGLTGSAGKTTTKEEIAFLLSNFAKVYATKGNFNNAVGVPYSLCNLDMESQFAVIEMGMSAKGEISYLTDLVKPDIAIITNVYPMHIEFFPNFEAIAYAKSEIFEGLPEKQGIAIINEDTNFSDIQIKQARTKTENIITFGRNHHPNVSFETQEQGEQHLYNAWCALTVIQALNLDVKKAAGRIKDFGALDGRGKKHHLFFKNGSYTLIDDSYSGQPEAMKFAIQSLDKMPTNGRKIVVLGKMAELGNTSKERHIEIGKLLAGSSIDVVVGVCPEMKDMLEQLPSSKTQYYFEDKSPIAEFLLNDLLQNNDTVLIKGARYSSKLYQLTEELIKHGEKQ